MGIKDVHSLKADDKIYHKHYGVCTVKENHLTITGELFGVILLPDTFAGRFLLHCQSKMPIDTPLMETSYRLILSKVESDGDYSVIKIKK